MPSLDSLLNGLELSIEPFALCRVQGNWALPLGRHPQATLHYALSGTGTMLVGNHKPIGVSQHSLVIVRAGLEHRLTNRGPDRTPADATPRCTTLGAGWREYAVGGAGGISLACASVRATRPGGQDLFDYMAEPLFQQVEPDGPIAGSLTALIDEQARPGPGSQALCKALLEQCLVHLLRRLCGEGLCQAPWLAVLDDARLGPAVQAIYEAPHKHHSLESLAAVAGMSRSSFSEHFGQTFGRPAMELLRQVRLERAAKLLLGSRIAVKSLAARVGFESRSYFSRAFKEHYGMSPAEYRDTHLQIAE